MKKLFLFCALLSLLVFNGCVQKPTNESQGGNPAFDRNAFARPCNSDADCNFSNLQRRNSQGQLDQNNFQRRQRDLNGFDANSVAARQCGNDTNCLQRLQQDRNRFRQSNPPVFKCISNVCQPTNGENQ